MSLFLGTENLNNSITPEEIASESYPNTPRLKADRHGTLRDFTMVMLRAFAYYQDKIKKKARDTWIPILHGHPHQKLKDASYIKQIKHPDDYYFVNPFCELITYDLQLQAPQGMHKAFGAEKLRNWQFRERIRDQQYPDVSYNVMARTHDNLIRFNCWASNGRAADWLADFFKEFTVWMTGSIMRQGFGKFMFLERGIDEQIPKWRDDIAVRTLQYYLKTEEHWLIPNVDITALSKEISIDYTAVNDFDSYTRSIVYSVASGVFPSGIDGSTVPSYSGVTNLGYTTYLEGYSR